MALHGGWHPARFGRTPVEQLVFETTKTAERIDRRYSVSRRLSALAQSAAYRARELDRDFEITQRCRKFTLDVIRDWPRYRKQLSGFLGSPWGGLSSMSWLFRIFIFATWVLPFAGPILTGAVANNLVVKGSCPACKRQFAGYKNQVVRCAGCGNIVWQLQGDLFSRGSSLTLDLFKVRSIYY